MIKRILHLYFPRIESRKFHRCLKIVFTDIGIFSAFVLLRSIATSFDLFEPTSHPISKKISDGDWKQLVKIFISPVLLTPLFEELAHRLCISTKRTYLLLGGSFMLSFVLIIFDLHYLLPFERFRPPIFFFSVGLSIYMVARFVVSKFQLRRDRLWIIILFSNVVFALIHLNVNTSQSNVLAYFLLLAPYFVSAYLFAYARLTMGLGYAILCHSMINGFYYTLDFLLRP